MSNSMLEQAIVDAKELREAAIKNAEAQIVEKYSSEVKQAVSRLLEQDEDIDMFPDAEEPEEAESTAMEQVPMAHLSDDMDEEVVVVDLDDILAAADQEPSEDMPGGELEREEIADEIGIDLMDDPVAPANRNDDEIDLDEGELLDIFKEMLAVDVPQDELDLGVEQSISEDSKDELEQDEELELVRKDGMNKDDIKDYERQVEQNESLKKENNNLKDLLGKVKNRLEEINLQNARLLYANRVLGDPSLNEQQKNKIVGMVGDARSVEEAKMVFETLQKTMATASKSSPESLSEVVSKPSSVILSGNRRQSGSNEKKSNPTYNRWATLAGTKK